MTPFVIRNEPMAHACVVDLSGDLDVAVVPELRSNLESALTAGCVNVVLDLADVVYADSSALGLLVWLDHRLSPVGGRLILTGAQPDVGRILELSGLISVAATIGMASSAESALAGIEMSAASGEPLWSHAVSIEADVNRLAAVREDICDAVTSLGFSESALFDIKVALGEALANAVRHGSPDSGEGTVQAEVIAYPDRIVVEVSDEGSGFDGTLAGSTDVYAPSGRGVLFMRALMDSVEFHRSDAGGTLVRLVKHRARSESERR